MILTRLNANIYVSVQNITLSRSVCVILLFPAHISHLYIYKYSPFFVIGNTHTRLYVCIFIIP